MNKKIFFIIVPIFILALAIGIGYSAWRIGEGSSKSVTIDDVQAYDVVNYNDYIDLTSNESYYQSAGKSKNVLKYYDTGFLDITSTNVQSEAVIRCYFSLIPSRLGISNNTFDLDFVLSEKDNLNLLNGTTVSSKVIQQTSTTGFEEIDASNTTTVSYQDISSNYSVRLYMYVEFVISGINFSTFKNNVSNVKFDLSVNISSDTQGKWKLLYNEELLPQKDNLTYLANNLDGKEKSVTGASVLVFKDSSGNDWSFLGTGFDSSNYSLSFYDETISGDDKWSSTLPKKAGTYEFKIKYDDSSTEYKTFNFTIVGTKIYAGSRSETYHIIELAYDEAAVKTWGSEFEGYIKNKLSFVLESGIATEITSSDFIIKRMTDLSFAYTKKGNNYLAEVPSEFSNKNNKQVEQYITVAGSTYYVTIELNNDDFTLENKIILKYKTAYSNSTYYTIEDAIKLNLQITMVANPSNTEYRTTAFSKYVKQNNLNTIYNSDCYYLSSTLIVPYENLGRLYSDNGYNLKQGTNAVTASCLYIPFGFTIQTAANIYVTADITTYGQTRQHAVIMNNGHIVCNGYNLKSYGYIKGNGKIELKNGASATDVMRILDYTNGLGSRNRIQSYGHFPFYKWLINNISCDIYINKGCGLDVMTYITGGGQYWDITVNIVSKSEATPNNYSLFSPDRYATNTDYILKKSTYYSDNLKNCNASAIVDNQANASSTFVYKSEIHIFGKYTDNEFQISLQGINANTGLQSNGRYTAVNISFMDIYLEANSQITISNTPLIFLRGTHLDVLEDAKLIINNKMYIAMDYLNTSTNNNMLAPYYKLGNYDSYILNKGSINVNDGYIGGKIHIIDDYEVGECGAIIGNYSSIPANTIRTRNDDSTSPNDSSYYQYSNSFGLLGSVLNNNLVINDYLMSNGNYESDIINISGIDYYYWNSINDTYNYIINFYDGLNNLIYSSSFSSIYSSYEFVGNEYIPTKDYYGFTGWMTTNGGSTSAIGKEILPNGTLNVYASWAPKIYTISYMPTFGTSIIDFNDSNLTNEENLIPSFQFDGSIFKYGNNYGTSSTTLSIASLDYTYNDKVCVFDGWDIYIDVLGNVYSKRVGNSLSANAFIQLNNKADEYGINLEEYDIPMVCRFYDYPTLTISYSTSGFGSYDVPSSQSGVGNFSFVTPNLSNYTSTLTTEQKYFAGWENTALGIDLGINENISVEINVTGSGYQYSINGISIPISNEPSVTLNVKWVNKPYVLTLDYMNGNTEDTYYMPNQQYVSSGTPTNSGYIFAGWYNEATCTNIFDTSSLITSNKTIYAKWVSPVSITFNANGGSGSMSNQEFAPGIENILTENSFTRTGYTFKGWNTQSNGSGESYSDKAKITISSNTTLYAQWTAIVYNISQATHNNDATCTLSSTTATYGSTVTYTPKDDDGITAVYIYATNGGDTTNYYVKNSSVTSETSYTFTMPAYDVTIYVDGESGCILADSKIMLYDGTYKFAKDITFEDNLVSFNHMTGEYESVKLAFFAIENGEHKIIQLEFENNITIKIAIGHGFFNCNRMKYEIYYGEEFYEHIGETFISTQYINGEFINVPVKLLYVNIYNENVDIYSPISCYNINLVTDNMLTVPDDIEGMFDAFVYNDDLSYNNEHLNELIQQYGLWTYDDFKDYAPEYAFDIMNFQFIKIALLSGVMTIDKVNHLLNKYLPMIVEQNNLDWDIEKQKYLSYDLKLIE